MIIKQTAQSIKRKSKTHAKASTWMVLIVIGYCLIYSVPIIGALLFIIPLSVLSITNFIKTTYSDDKLLASRKELEISDGFIVFKKYRNGKISREKRFSVSDLRGYKEKGSYITFKLGKFIDNQVIKFEYEPQDIDALRLKLKDILLKAPEASERGLLFLKSIWVAMLLSLIIFIFTGQYFIYNDPMFLSDDFPIDTLRYIFYIIPIFLLIGIRYFRKIIGSLKQYPIRKKYITLTIVSLGFAFSAGLYGLALALIANSIIDLYIFTLLSANLIYYYRPKDSELELLIKQEQELPNN